MATITGVTTASITGDRENVPGKKIKIQSNDGHVYEIDEGEIEQSSTIKTLSECMVLPFFRRFRRHFLCPCSSRRWRYDHSLTEC